MRIDWRCIRQITITWCLFLVKKWGQKGYIEMVDNFYYGIDWRCPRRITITLLWFKMWKKASKYKSKYIKNKVGYFIIKGENHELPFYQVILTKFVKDCMNESGVWKYVLKR